MDVVTFEQTSITTSLFLNSTLRSGDDGVGVFEMYRSCKVEFGCRLCTAGLSVREMFVYVLQTC